MQPPRCHPGLSDSADTHKSAMSIHSQSRPPLRLSVHPYTSTTPALHQHYTSTTPSTTTPALHQH
eukprot:1180265-Prorocentrum_minimum.AAC.1